MNNRQQILKEKKDEKYQNKKGDGGSGRKKEIC